MLIGAELLESSFDVATIMLAALGPAHFIAERASSREQYVARLERAIERNAPEAYRLLNLKNGPAADRALRACARVVAQRFLQGADLARALEWLDVADRAPRPAPDEPWFESPEAEAARTAAFEWAGGARRHLLPQELRWPRGAIADALGGYDSAFVSMEWLGLRGGDFGAAIRAVVDPRRDLPPARGAADDDEEVYQRALARVGASLEMQLAVAKVRCEHSSDEEYPRAAAACCAAAARLLEQRGACPAPVRRKEAAYLACVGVPLAQREAAYAAALAAAGADSTSASR